LLACHHDKTASPSHENLAQGNHARTASCVEAGGEIEEVGLAGIKMCIHLFADRGKQCRNDSDCEGECRYVDDSRPPEEKNIDTEVSRMKTPLGTPVVGHCQWSNNQSGCR